MRRTAIVLLSIVVLAAPGSLAGSLSGQVTRSDTGAAVAGALVAVRGTGLLAISDAGGNYSLPAVPDGSYGLTCASPGLRGSATGATWVGDDATHDFVLDPPSEVGAIQGVASCSGTACQGVLLSARQGSRTLGLTISQAGGSFTLVGLAAGDYDLRGEKYAFLPKTVALTLPPPATDGGSTLVEQNIDLAAGGSYTLSGVVALSDNPLDRSGSTIRCNGQDPALTSNTNTGGSYTLSGVPAGPLSFTAFRAGYRSATRIDVQMTADLSLDFVLEKDDNGTTNPTYRLSGTVSLSMPDGGTPPSAAGSHVSIWENSGQFRRQTMTDDQGAFSIGGIPAGNYQAGAGREGFLTSVADEFDIQADRNMDFRLYLDPDYDWGPGVAGPGTGCGCASTGGGGLLGLVLLLFLSGLKRWMR
ncbi:MAG TPA: carboxypeptidase-like regulatory domain-containing protein [Myxococcota bacterium]|nr:carboxypeptidase-like regulatory domain-containing protein [Myxococcota bacterium]